MADHTTSTRLSLALLLAACADGPCRDEITPLSWTRSSYQCSPGAAVALVERGDERWVVCSCHGQAEQADAGAL